MKNHTATHLLHAALRNVLGEHVKQSGSLVSDEKLRFDFTHFYGLSKEEREETEDMVNEVILQDRKVITDIMTVDEAIASGATALFDEKYGDTVRVVRVENFSKELCGGTHCRAAGEIGPFVIVGESSVASGIRRIEALTGQAAFHFFRKKEQELEAIADLLRTDNPVEKVKRAIEDNKVLRREIEALKTTVSAGKGADILDSAKDIKGTKVLAFRQDNLSPGELRSLADKVKDRLKSGILFLASVKDGQAAMLSMVTKDLQGKYHAGAIFQKVSEISGGRGGGNESMAQGGTKNIEKLDKALEMVYDIVKDF